MFYKVTLRKFLEQGQIQFCKSKIKQTHINTRNLFWVAKQYYIEITLTFMGVNIQFAGVFLQRPRQFRPLAKSHIFPFLPGDLYWNGSEKSYYTLIGRHTLGVVQMHEYQPLTKLWCVHLLNPAMQGLTERCRTQIF